MLIYDIEIKRAILNKGEEPIPGIEYAAGWHDFAGMGIAVINAFDLVTQRYRVFLEDNLDEFASLATQRAGIVSFNGLAFDDQVCRANGIDWPTHKTVDLAALIWGAAGIPQGEHQKGLGLDAICQANGLGSKSGNGAMAPVLWQQGKHGQVIDYGLCDVMLTLGLYRRLLYAGGCIDPRNHGWIAVEVPQ